MKCFEQKKQSIAAKTILPWSEHCTECAWPTCYTTCDLYEPRKDGKCRRFVDGIVRVDGVDGVVPYLMKVRFKRWAKIWSEGTLSLFAFEDALKIEQQDHRVGSMIAALPVPNPFYARIVKTRYSQKHKRSYKRKPTESPPTHFLLECYNPQSQAIDATLTVRPRHGPANKFPFERRLSLAPGYNRQSIPFDEISAATDLSKRFTIELSLNEEAEGTILYFGAMDFVIERDQVEPKQIVSKHPKCKCIVWDLDNTIWHGILVEDGLEGLQPRDGIAAILRSLDERGILHSIASKNDTENALAALSHFGLLDYFIYPQISWGSKGRAVQAIAENLNIGLNTLLFIDDSEFERNEVAHFCPEVQVLAETKISTLLDRPEFQVPVSDESRRRRQLYKQQIDRENVHANFGGDYFEFLRSCQPAMTIGPLTDSVLQRVHELTQRTNQMNFSGTRYDHEGLALIESSDHLDAYVIQCEDKFGSYGTVGFAVVDKADFVLRDLMFSCRIQSKRYEHAFMAFLLQCYLPETTAGFFANYRRTSRNEASGQVFDDFNFQVLRNENGVTRLLFPKEQLIPDDNIVDVKTPPIAPSTTSSSMR